MVGPKRLGSERSSAQPRRTQPHLCLADAVCVEHKLPVKHQPPTNIKGPAWRNINPRTCRNAQVCAGKAQTLVGALNQGIVSRRRSAVAPLLAIPNLRSQFATPEL